MNLSASKKGLITGLLMVAVGILLYLNKVNESSGVQFIGYLIYGAGIVWTLVAFNQKAGGIVKFGELFNQGFRCFVVVTLLMAIFTFAFYKTNNELLDQKAALTRQELLKTEKNRTPKEIDEMIENGKKNFAVFATSGAIFQYLFIGAIVTMATSGLLFLRNKKS